MVVLNLQRQEKKANSGAEAAIANEIFDGGLQSNKTRVEVPKREKTHLKGAWPIMLSRESRVGRGRGGHLREKVGGGQSKQEDIVLDPLFGSTIIIKVSARKSYISRKRMHAEKGGGRIGFQSVGGTFGKKRGRRRNANGVLGGGSLWY